MVIVTIKFTLKNKKKKKQQKTQDLTIIFFISLFVGKIYSVEDF